MAVVLGGVMATVFAIALYAAGQSSAITGVLAGRILTRGFRGRESRAWLRGIVTRVVAVAIGFTLMTRGRGQSPDHLLEIGRAHVCTPVTNAHHVSRLLLDKTPNSVPS